MAGRLLGLQDQAKLETMLWTCGIFGVKPDPELIRLKSGRESPHYANLRLAYGGYEQHARPKPSQRTRIQPRYSLYATIRRTICTVGYGSCGIKKDYKNVSLATY